MPKVQSLALDLILISQACFRLKLITNHFKMQELPNSLISLIFCMLNKLCLCVISLFFSMLIYLF